MIDDDGITAVLGTSLGEDDDGIIEGAADRSSGRLRLGTVVGAELGTSLGLTDGRTDVIEGNDVVLRVGALVGFCVEALLG